MKNNLFRTVALLFAGCAIISCENEFDESVAEGGLYTSGDADFTNYVAVGNSLTAGFADGALYLQGQENSYPAIMAEQMSLAGGGDFIQPLVNDNLGGLTAQGVQITDNRFVLAANGESLGPAVLAGTPTTEITNKVTGPLNNYGVPGARVYHLLAPGYGSLGGLLTGTANPYYVRFSTSETSTVIADAAAADPTFFSLWIGNNDILGYATSGGVGVDNNVTGNVDPAAQGNNSITNNQLFAGAYQQLVQAMTANGAQGALVNIPDVTSIPFFTTVPFAPLSPLDENFGPQIPLLNATYAQLNQAFAFLGVPERSIQFSQTAASAVVIRDESLTDIGPGLSQALQFAGFSVGQATLFAQQFGQARQATSADLITFTAAPVIGQLNQARFAQLVAAGLTQAEAGQLSINGVTFPLQDQFTLTTPEQDAISNAQTSYNSTIEQLAMSNDLAFVDARSFLADVASGGVAYDGGLLTSTYATGGAFSLDAVHPTARGYAFTANALLQAINEKYNANVPLVNIGQYPSVQPCNDTL